MWCLLTHCLKLTHSLNLADSIFEKSNNEKAKRDRIDVYVVCVYWWWNILNVKTKICYELIVARLATALERSEYTMRCILPRK